MATTAFSVAETCAAAKLASRQLASVPSGVKDAALEAIAAAIDARADEILEANARDLAAAAEGDYSSAFLDKLRLDDRRVAAMRAGVRKIVSLPDPVGEVIYAASGNCHVYVDADADLEDARRIALNAKLQRPGVCNALETLLVHARIADQLLPGLLRALNEASVVLHGDDRARAAAPGVPMDSASDEDLDEEYLALGLAVGIVDSDAEASHH